MIGKICFWRKKRFLFAKENFEGKSRKEDRRISRRKDVTNFRKKGRFFMKGSVKRKEEIEQKKERNITDRRKKE